jgi:hypothetical protein
MQNALLCPTCAATAHDDATISDAIIASGIGIFVCGINYAAFEEIIRPVFSQMPSNFENHSGACFLRYQSGGSHNYDFTLVVVGEDNENASSLLQELMPRLDRMVILGPMPCRDSALLSGSPSSKPTSLTIISAEGNEDRREYFAAGMKLALCAVSSESTL